jgi:RNA polymerase sigma-70 factor (ECF subfamily)
VSPDAQAVFTALVREHYEGVYRYFYHQIGHIQDADDLTAETFETAFCRFAQYHPQLGSLPAWLFGIAHNCLRKYWRNKPSVEQLPPEVWDPYPLPECRLLTAERAAALHRAIRRLPADQQEAVALRFFGDLHTKSVAEVLGKSEGAVKMLIYRAVMALRRCSTSEDWR